MEIRNEKMSEPKLIEFTQVLMDVGQVAVYLGIPKSTVYSLSMTAKIPHYHIGRLLKFKKDAIDSWLSDTSINGSGRGR